MMRRRRTSERGSALVEMAVVLPILVLLIHGIFYFGRGYVNKEKVEMAARYAAWEKIGRPGRRRGKHGDRGGVELSVRRGGRGGHGLRNSLRDRGAPVRGGQVYLQPTALGRPDVRDAALPSAPLLS